MLYVSESSNYDSYYLVMDRRAELVIPWQGLITSDGSHHSMYILLYFVWADQRVRPFYNYHIV